MISENFFDNNMTNIKNIYSSNDSIPSNATLQKTQLPQMTAMSMVVITFCALICLTGMVGNGFICYYFGKVRRMKCLIPERLFSYLGSVDLLASIFNPLLYMYWAMTHYRRWDFGYWGCKLIAPVGPILTSMSTGLLVIIAVDRQKSIVQPFQARLKLTNSYLALLLAFLYALLMNVHYCLNISITNRRICGITDVQALAYAVPTICVFMVQDLLMIGIFAVTNYRIFNHLSLENDLSLLGVLARRRRAENKRTVRLLISLASIFFLLTLPRDIFMFSYIFSWIVTSEGISYKHAVHINGLLKIMNISQCCVNFFIYLRMHQGFRKYLGHLLLKRANQPGIGRSSTFDIPLTTRSISRIPTQDSFPDDPQGMSKNAENNVKMLAL